VTDKHLFIFNIGPVQGFIAEARRTRDLFVGSRLLVELIRAAANAVDKIAGLEWVYPGSASQDSLPNRFVVFVPAAQVDRVCEVAEKAVQDAWACYASHARDELIKVAPPEDKVWKAIWERQIAMYPQIYWAVCRPPSASEIARLLVPRSNHAIHCIIASLALNARKRMRQFTQTAERGEKDTLSGTREALHNNNLNARFYWREVSRGLLRQGNPSLVRPDGRERLDALGAIKRFVPPENFAGVERFPSTSSFAAADFRRRIAAEQTAFRALEKHRQQIAALRVDGRKVFVPRDGFAADIGLAAWDYDGDLLYDSTFIPQTFKDDYGLNVQEKDLKLARKSLRDLYRAAGCRPSTYYAILMMDADDMSAKIAGCSSLKEHQALSQKLSEFASQVPEIVEGKTNVPVFANQERKLAGRVVYAGGDDVLALLPAADALPAASALRKAFQDRVTKLVPQATVSAGIALIHHRHPLDAALRAAREAEHAAKQMSGKDALCVYALKRSGEAVRVQSKWTYDKVNSVSALIERLRNLFTADGPLSPKFAYEVFAEAPALALNLVPLEALEKELSRLLTRHLDPQKMKHLAQEKPDETAKRVAQELAGPLARLGKALDAHRQEWEKSWYETHLNRVPAPLDEDYAPQPGVLELGKWLLLARFLAMGGDE